MKLYGLIVENNPLVACNIVDVNVPLINVYKTNTKTSSKRRRKANIEQSWPTASCCRLIGELRIPTVTEPEHHE